jgi:predicted  nucleic acid-binding Zn-ribbon protein
MSSPLDGRIRKIAHDEAAALLGHTATGVQGAEDLQKQITDLHEHLHHAATTIKRLEDRVDALEKTPSASEQAKTASRRTAARKETSE